LWDLAAPYLQLKPKNDKSAMNNRDGTKQLPFVQVEHINKG